MRIKILKNNKDYESALTYFEDLMDKESLSASEKETLELLAHVIEDYESRHFEETIPDPIDAIKFIMEQEGLTNNDLVPFIGNKSKVSEVLSGKRKLSVNMMKSLRDGLSIPEKILLNQKDDMSDLPLDYDSFPVKEMIQRGYIDVDEKESKSSISAKIKNFISNINGVGEIKTLMSKTTYIRSSKKMSYQALVAWVAKVVSAAERLNVTTFDPKLLNNEFMKRMVKMSASKNAINRVLSSLNDIGIIVIVEPHLKRTYLDGAAIMLAGKNPIIGLTIRYDRLDNFWFTLLHELAHIKLHYGKGITLFVDDIESTDQDTFELEADTLASEIMIPNKKWKESHVSILPSEQTVKILADDLGIHPAIVAGKARYQSKSYHILKNMVGAGEVRSNFRDVNWK